MKIISEEIQTKILTVDITSIIPEGYYVEGVLSCDKDNIMKIELTKN